MRCLKISFASLMITALVQTVIVSYTASVALLGDTLHDYADALTGAGVAGAGFPLADAVVGVLFTLAILLVLRSAAREVYRRLMDAVDPALVDRAEGAIGSAPGVVEVTDVRLRWMGHRLLAGARIAVGSSTSLTDARHLSHRVEHDRMHAVRRLSAATIHVEPLALDSSEGHDLVSHHR
jgi:divalent metal cation (Fe/Co/Zn/Cd) transporter